MVQEWVVTLRFNKEKMNFLAPSSQQSRNQPTKVAPPKAKGTKPNLDGGFTSYSAKQGGEEKCWRCGGPSQEEGLSQFTTSHNFQP
jgi:hypothetical protein